MSDSKKAYAEMQEEKALAKAILDAKDKKYKEEKILSDQGGEYTVPKKGAEAKEKKNYSHYAAKYIFLLDFNNGKVYRYDISSLCNYNNNWNPDHESCEAFLYGAGHSVKDCEWMVTSEKNIEYGN